MKKIILTIVALGTMLPSLANQTIIVNGRSINTSSSYVNSYSNVNTVVNGVRYPSINQGVFFNQFNQSRVNYSAPGAYNNYVNQVTNINNQIRVRNF